MQTVQRQSRLKIKGKIVRKQPMVNLNSFRIGGMADLFIIPEDMQDLREITHYCQHKKYPFFVIGNGSKLLVRDQGYRGAVIKLGGNFRHIREEDGEIIVGAGSDLATLIDFTVQKGLAGLESLVGIPGTVGGAVVRNASAFGEAISDRIVWVKAMDVNDENGDLTLSRDKINFKYRSSLFLQKKNLILTQIKLRLFPDDRKEIISRIQEATRRKIQTQPLSFPSAGCIFKNPPHYSAGYLIQNTGCLGMKVGDAQVSFQHGNFIINKGRAKAADVLQLIQTVKEKVKEKFHITLEPEVEII